MATAFGEINGVVTERIENLAKLFKTAKLPYVIKKDMQAYLITHSVSDIAMLSVLHSENKIIDKNSQNQKDGTQNNSHFKNVSKGNTKSWRFN